MSTQLRYLSVHFYDTAHQSHYFFARAGDVLIQLVPSRDLSRGAESELIIISLEEAFRTDSLDYLSPAASHFRWLYVEATRSAPTLLAFEHAAAAGEKGIRTWANKESCWEYCLRVPSHLHDYGCSGVPSHIRRVGPLGDFGETTDLSLEDMLS